MKLSIALVVLYLSTVNGAVNSEVFQTNSAKMITTIPSPIFRSMHLSPLRHRYQRSAEIWPEFEHGVTISGGNWLDCQRPYLGYKGLTPSGCFGAILSRSFIVYYGSKSEL